MHMVRSVLLDEVGLNKSSKLKVLAVWVGCNGLVKLNNEGFRIPSLPSKVLGFGEELAVFVWDTLTAVAIPLWVIKSALMALARPDKASKMFRKKKKM